MAIDEEEWYDTLELLDAAVDKQHRSFMSAVHGVTLKTLRACVPMSTMPIDQCWIPKYVVQFVRRVNLCFI
jgi:hypothetical protein